MLCRIAELNVEVPEAGGLAPRCRDYLCKTDELPDFTIREEVYQLANWPDSSAETVAYMESGIQFYGWLLKFYGLMLHASAVEMEGRAYLFSGQCGMGKSTHARLWQKAFGERAQVFNDDKPALRLQDGQWYAYGTPWCGKDGINQNKKVALAGICFLKRGTENSIRQLSAGEAIQNIVPQTLYKLTSTGKLDRMLLLVEKLVEQIPVFELYSVPTEAAAHLSHDTMLSAAKELGL